MSATMVTDHAPPPVVTCRIGMQTYAIPLNSVLQVVRLPSLISLAGAPPAICGLLNLRGELLPVLAGAKLFDAPADYGLEHQVIIAADPSGKPSLGLLVDEVYQVRRFAAGSFVPLSQGDALICGALRSREETALLLDPEVLLQRAAVG